MYLFGNSVTTTVGLEMCFPLSEKIDFYCSLPGCIECGAMQGLSKINWFQRFHYLVKAVFYVLTEYSLIHTVACIVFCSQDSLAASHMGRIFFHLTWHDLTVGQGDPPTIGRTIGYQLNLNFAIKMNHDQNGLLPVFLISACSNFESEE